MFIDLDLGTSGLKGVAIREAQTVIATATAPLSLSRPRFGWLEQDPADWIKAAEHVLDEPATQMPIAEVRRIGPSGQIHGATPLGADDEVLRLSILWNDTRSGAESTEMDARPDWRAISGNIVFPGFAAPKLAWMRNQEPQLFNKVRKVLLPSAALADG